MALRNPLTTRSELRLCRVCSSRLPKGRRATCSALCAATANAHRRPFDGSSHPTGGRTGKAYQAAVTVVRQRAQDGEGCYFCGAGFDWNLPANHRAAFTAHHLDRLMDGHPAVCEPSRMAPAHRGCNSADGLRAFNKKKATQRKGALDPWPPY